MQPREETKATDSSRTEVSDTECPSTPLLGCSRDTVVAETIHDERLGREPTTRLRASYSWSHRHLRSCILLLCCWSLTIGIVVGDPSTTSRVGRRSVRSMENIKSQMRSLLLRRRDTTESFGFYYGIPRMVIEPLVPNDDTGVDESDEQNDDDEISVAKRRYYEGYERIGRDVENWADEILREGHVHRNNDLLGVQDEDGWTEVFCAKAFRQKFNIGSNSATPITRQWVKWMKDSRGLHADPNDNQKHPCMKLIATIDAPFPVVCRYLSEKDRFREYNSLLVDQEDVEILTPHSKICWSQSKKLLFIQPRDFVTYCRHRWLNDGTQLITNQACDHPNTALSISGTNTQNSIRGLSGYRAFSLRGATYISRCPDFPNERTKVVMLSHCNCGRDVPEWAVRAAVGVLAPIKPFEIIHRIDVGIRRSREELERAEKKLTSKSATPSPTLEDDRRSSRPAGIAQMGYACFWPEGGGLVDE